MTRPFLLVVGVAVILSVIRGGPPASAAEPAGEPIRKTFRYKTTAQGPLEIVAHLPAGWKESDRRPAIVFFFGGGWNSGKLGQFETHADHLARRGMVALRADYRVKSRHQVAPDRCVEDAKSAIRWVRAEAPRLGIDPDRIVAAGGSAGGHIAACACLTEGLEPEGEDQAVSSRPNALVLFNPVLRFDGVPQFMERIGNDEALGRKISPTLHVSKETPPTLLFYGTDDRLLAQGEEFLRKAKEVGSRAEIDTAEGQSHGYFNRDPWRERTTARMDVFLASLGYLEPKPQEARRPNILLFIADDWSHGHAGAYGCRWIKTPAFDRVAKEGILFTNAFTNNPKCSPCRASLLTGRNTWQLEEAMCHNGIFPAKWPVYPDLLERSGYLVGHTGKGWGPGDFKAGGFERNPAGPGYQQFKQKPPLQGMGNTDLARNFAAFLGERKPGQPFCFWVGSHEPHRAYEEGAGRRAGRDPASVTLPGFYPDSDVIRSDMLDYAMEVERFDAELGRVLDQLEKTGELDDTLIVVTSDHGMPFPRVKGQIYEPGFHLPLAIRWGRHVKPGRVVGDFINVRDFAPTFLGAAGLEAPGSMTGRSFLDVLRSEASGQVDPTRNRMVVGKERHDLGRPDDQGYPVRALRTPDYLYVHNYEPDRWPVGNPETSYPNCDNGPTKTLITFRFDEYYRLCFGKRPAEELYRVGEDPDCVKNLASDPSLQALKRDLKAEMEALLRKDEDPRMFGRGAIFESYKYMGARGHSYEEWLEHSR